MPTLSVAKKIEKDDNCLKFLMALFVKASGSYTKIDFEKLTKQFKAPYELKKYLLRKEIVKELKPASNILFWKGNAPTDTMVEELLSLIDKEKNMKAANARLNDAHNSLIARKGLIPISKEAAKEVKRKTPINPVLVDKYVNFLTALKLSIGLSSFKSVSEFCKQYQIGGPTRSSLSTLGIIKRSNNDKRNAKYIWSYPTGVTNELAIKLIEATRSYRPKESNNTLSDIVPEKDYMPITETSDSKTSTIRTGTVGKHTKFLKELRDSIIVNNGVISFDALCKKHKVSGFNRTALNTMLARSKDGVWSWIGGDITKDKVVKYLEDINKARREYKSSSSKRVPVETLNNNITKAIKEDKWETVHEHPMLRNNDLETKKNVAKLFVELGDFKEAEKILQTLVKK